MQSIKIKPEEAKRGDRVYIEMVKRSDRSGTVMANDPEEERLDIMGDNLVSMSIEYGRIISIEKVVDGKSPDK